MDGASTGSSRTLKREREDEDEDIVDERSSKQQTTCIKHEVHWALDGNLLLQFGDVRFKVHRSRLVSESPYFQALIETSLGKPNQGYEFQLEIEDVFNSKEVVDGIDCYHFSPDSDHFLPNAEEFSVLLDAMNGGIDYVHAPPTFATIKDLLSAAVGLRVPRYITFCVVFVKRKFQSGWRSVPEASSSVAVEAVLLGSEFEQLEDILPSAYYELARNPASAKNGKLGELNSLQLRKLINLQQRLCKQWDTIASALEVDCSKSSLRRPICKICHHVSLKVFLSAQNAYPLDPILGIRRLLRTNWVGKKYCESAAIVVQERLQARADHIWGGLHGWLDEVREDTTRA